MNGGMKRFARLLLLGSACLCLADLALSATGRIPFWLSAAALVLAFPPAVLALFLLWMAGEGKEDIPFIGY